jgi:hypothetical protein
MNRSRGLRGYRSLISFTPQRRASERLRKYKKTGRYSGTSVLAGRKHKKTPFSFRRKLSRLHTRYDIPYTHTTHTHTHHIRHTHTRHTVSEGFVFTHPDLCAHKLTWGWFNTTEKPSFTGVLHTFTGVLHTTRPWFRQILPLQENGRKGSQVRQDRRFQQRLDDDRIRREQFQQRRVDDRIQREHQALNQETQEREDGRPREAKS